MAKKLLDKREISSHVMSSVTETLTLYRQHITYRNDALFTEFLPQGYSHVTLSSVNLSLADNLLIAKIHLGIFITLLDDFADNPNYLNSKLLTEIYKIPFYSEYIQFLHLNKQEKEIISLADYVIQKLIQHIETLPHYATLKKLFEFDLRQFYSANHFCELINTIPSLANPEEIISLRPYNMGMVISGMLDIMASPTFDLSELGKTREILYLGQRFGSICNTLITFHRELLEHDVTNEIIIKGFSRQLVTPAELQSDFHEMITNKLANVFQELDQERSSILTKITRLGEQIHSFDCEQYIASLINLQCLHEALRGVI